MTSTSTNSTTEKAFPQPPLSGNANKKFVALVNGAATAVDWAEEQQGSSPSDIGSVAFDYDALDVNDTGIDPSDGATVSTWSELSGNGVDGTAAGAGTSVFTWEQDGLNGTPCVQFIAADAADAKIFLALATSTSSGPKTFYMVAESVDETENLIISGGSTSRTFWLNRTGGSGASDWYKEGASPAGGSQITESGPVIAIWRLNGALGDSLRLNIDGNQDRTDTPNPDSTITSLQFFQYTQAVGGVNATGRIGRFGCFDKDLSGIELSELITYLASRHGF